MSWRERIPSRPVLGPEFTEEPAAFLVRAHGLTAIAEIMGGDPVPIEM
jgi:hypothetical protein